MQGEKVDPTIFTEYRGKRVYFCCESCVEDFKADPEAYLHLLPQFADGASAAEAPAAAPGASAAEAPAAAPGASAAEAPAAAPAPAGGETGAAPKSPREKHPLGGLHPVLVHFPVALSLVAFLAQLVSLLLAGKFLRNFAALSIVIAAAFAVPSFLLGEEAEEAMGAMSASRHERVEDHAKWGEISMYVVGGAALLTLLCRILPDKPAARLLVLLALLAAAGAVGYAGYLGGEVVRPGHLEHLL
jgi:uncharacterized membrane protein/YHS domain-containing protein